MAARKVTQPDRNTQPLAVVPAAPEPEQMDLFELATEIKAEHEAGVATVGKLAGHAMRIGRLLVEAQIKVQTEGLKWGEWVDKNLPFGVREASNYLKVAKADRKRVSDSTTDGSKSLRKALRELIAPADDADKAKPEQSGEPEPAEFHIRGTINRVAHAISVALNDWPEERDGELIELIKVLRGFVQKIEDRRRGQ